ncbi:MAG: hypothetical protein RBG13Loki_2246 [Promethearchaeota archaeon CR_4]|nr:MAG: hypothetical protein RBG13Loki_2246 [Candidatus Lokiarchaeota archaeon CR_4]
MSKKARTRKTPKAAAQPPPAEEVKTDVKTKKPDDKEKGKKAPKLTAVGEIFVDFWATSLHLAKIGIMQNMRYQAASRAFTKDFAINGAIQKDGKDFGFFGYRKDSWDEAQLPNRRLIMKFFQQDPEKEEKIQHEGTVEWMMMESVRASISAADQLLTFRLLVPGSNVVCDLKREYTRFLKHGENLSFITPVTEDEFQIIELDEDRFTIGSDWEVKDQAGKVIAYVDESVFNVGGKFKIRFYDETWYKRKDFVTRLILFVMTLKYHDEIKKDVKKIIEGLRNGTLKLKPSHDEKALMLNPRTWGRRA